MVISRWREADIVHVVSLLLHLVYRGGYNLCSLDVSYLTLTVVSAAPHVRDGLIILLLSYLLLLMPLIYI